MSSTHHLIIGANRGIGLALARELCHGATPVIAACRSTSPDLDALPVQIETGVDVADLGSLRALSQRLGDLRINTLIVVAGVLSKEALNAMDEDALSRMQHQFNVNTLGPLRAISALRGHLGKGSKIGILTSRMGSMADNGSGGYYGYRASKAAVNAVGVSLARDLAADEISVVLLHPGFVRTEMTGGQGDVDAATSAKGLLARLEETTLDNTGRFVHADGTELPF
ncbi:SDR family oxidoreductase [Pseudomarimonas arenosa]|uniref:SDR family oxidoreductase n=1 Tax=Pseudomarimonas arenosa TaxID=2774145 RepID=A0AAW3ZND6_9GAMM|nr:SDR family oxidoreductase [Pseudomarimonas arenosa]MBD8527673.1 SDR family oxidoreductase [Pseudomarimonas arenosa]